MVWQIELSDVIASDLTSIEDFIFHSATSLGEPTARASEMADRCIRTILADLGALTRAPHQGTRCPELGPNTGRVTKDRAIYYFDLIEDRRVIRILAIFFSGQDHDARILARLLTPD
ncbi:MAG: type II toxin-antitoxin system RelE/ParE family toxin [Rhodobacteraceae bacterium]|nr:type II toxin-antitoxin system RelE/ParE family toxin [Paracoccaceae bacterium]